MKSRTLLLAILCLHTTYTAAEGEYVCYRDTVCSVEDPRPVFTVAESVDQCCRMPHVLSAMQHDSSNCSYCGNGTAERASPRVVVLMPPEPLVLEVRATGYSAITWLYNQTIMHDYPRLVLEEYSKRLILLNTSAEDRGLYEADIHLLEGEIVTISFTVIQASVTTQPTTTTAPTEPSDELSVDAWPVRQEVNIYQTNKMITFLCEATNAEVVTWTSTVIVGQTLDEYCMETDGEAPIDTTQPPFDCTMPSPTSAVTDVYDYTTDFEGPLRTEVLIEPSPSPCVPSTAPPNPTGPQLSPEHCSVAAIRVDNRTIQSMLVIDASLIQESITFMCNAENIETTARASVELIITETPYFLRRPRAPGGLVLLGYLELECTAIAAAPPTISWHRLVDNQTSTITSDDRTTVQIIMNSDSSQGNSTDSKLSIDNLQLTDTGLYVCQASSGSLVRQVDTLVQIRVPATIIVGPANGEVSEGSTAELTCTSFGIPAPMIFWSRVNEPGSHELLDDLSHQNITIATETDLDSNTVISHLSISSAQLSDEGTYLCNTSNGIVPNEDSIQYSEAYLTITPVMDIRITTNQSLQDLNEGDTLYLECVTQGSLQITWLRNGQPLSIPDVGTGSRYTVIYQSGERTLSMLIVHSLVPGEDNDEGFYTCRLDNTTTAESVQVVIKPIDNCINSPCVNGTCTDGIKQYICTCEPGFEGVNCSQLADQEKVPTIVEPPTDKLDIGIFETVMFRCTATGSPAPQYTWHKDGVFVRNTSTGDLIVLEARPQDRGFYTCIAHNQLGSSTLSAAGLLSLRGVYQYLVTFSNCNTSSLEETLEIMTISLSGLTLDPLDAIIYSFTRRLVRIDEDQPDDQVVVTIVTGNEYIPIAGSTADIQNRLTTMLRALTTSHGCVIVDIRRYDGCPKTEYAVSKEVNVTWDEADINSNVLQPCPCGKLNIQAPQVLSRQCDGTFTYGAEWSPVINDCPFSNVTIGLCDITTFDVSEQFIKLTQATGEIESFNELDISITSLIVSNLVSSEEVLTNKQHQESLVTTYDNLLKANKEVVADSQMMYNSSSMLLDSLDVFGLRIQLTDTSTLLTKDLITFQVTDSPVSNFNGLSFVPVINGSSDNLLLGINITIPKSLVDHVQNSANLRLVNTALESDTLFVFNETDRTVGNVFISATLPNRVSGLIEPVVVEFYMRESTEEMTEDVTCVFWEFPSNKDEYGRWSSEGCQLVAIEEGRIRCECTHLTHFGVLLAIQEVSPTPSLPLEIITYIGIGVSLVCITVILITYICSRKLRSTVLSRLIINVCIPLGLFYIWFLLATQGRHYHTDTVDVVWFCYVCSSLVQYFLLVYLCWTTVEVLHIYLKLVKVFGTNIHHFLLKAAVFAWGVPLVITAVCTGVGIHYGYWFVSGSDSSIFICYPTKYPLYGGVIAPFCLVYVFNLLLFTVIMISLTRRLHGQSKIKGDLTKTNSLKELRKLLIIATCLSVLFGLGWVFGLTAQVPQPLISTISQYLFSVLVGFQGAFIFILHGLRSIDVRKQWKRWLYKLLCCVQTPPDLLSTTSPPQSPTSGKTFSHGATKLETDRYSQNPIYQSTDQLNDDSYSPVHKTTESDKEKLVPSSPIKHSREVDEHREAQTVEVSYVAGQESSDEEVDFSDINKVPFADGEMGTAIGPDLRQHVDTHSLQLTEL